MPNLVGQPGIYRLIEQSDYPGTNAISKLASILCFIALKLSDVRRYSADDIWCMDRGLGLFAGLDLVNIRLTPPAKKHQNRTGHIKLIRV
jgi:hypothetical protein